jgi:hypothetical protein
LPNRKFPAEPTIQLGGRPDFCKSGSFDRYIWHKGTPTGSWFPYAQPALPARRVHSLFQHQNGVFAMKSIAWALLIAAPIVTVAQALPAAEGIPFEHRIEVYRSGPDELAVFALRLEQPFLAEEFEKSNYLRLRPADDHAYLIYPTETKFQQKHAEFYGRLRGEGAAKLRLSYEIVSENVDGTRRVEVRTGDIEVAIPALPKDADELGSRRIFTDWAVQQNLYFADLLKHYPEETFYQYCLLQSQARYGVAPPPLPRSAPNETGLETDLYQVVTGSMAIQESLQHQRLSSSARSGDLNRHISTLSPPALQSLPYEELLKKKAEKGIEPAVHEMSRLVPEDQYFAHFSSVQSLGELFDLNSQWGGNLLRLVSVRAQDQQVQEKLEEQLCVRRDRLAKLFGDGVLSEIGVTGADPFVYEGSDVTLIFRVKNAEAFDAAAKGWIDEARQRHPDMVDREFNYRAHQVAAYYTNDRTISAFIVRHDDWAVYSNSHRAIRRVIDTAAGLEPPLHDALDYRYVSTILPPKPADNTGYVFASEALIKHMVGPTAKISEKRRLECFNNLVMLNNASLFFRLEYGRSPESLSELIEKRFIDLKKVVCPHGGAYAIDAENDTCTCSAHNRLRYLTPNAELSLLMVSEAEAAEYERYKQRYAAFWQNAFDPIAMRLTLGKRVKVETCVLPFANSSFYREMQDRLDKNPQPLSTARIAPSAVASLVMVPGRENLADVLRSVPGVSETLLADPTLTDMKWLGDRVELHFCDGETILQVDPTKLRATNVPFLGNVPVETQAMAASMLMAMKLPVYVAIEVETPESASRLLAQLSQQMFLEGKEVLPGVGAGMDAYRVPDYKGHAMYVFSGQLYAIKLRLHVALVGDQLVAATKPEVLREVIDVAAAKPVGTPEPAHVLLRFNRRGLARMWDDLQLFWAEKSRVACHRNISSIHNFCTLYNVPADEVPRLSEAKYGIRYFCPDGGSYAFDAELSQAVCSVHGNREKSRQHPPEDGESFFAQFLENLEEITASLRYTDDALIATLEILRSE